MEKTQVSTLTTYTLSMKLSMPAPVGTILKITLPPEIQMRSLETGVIYLSSVKV